MAYVGYQFAKERLKLGILPIERPAAVGPVTRIERLDRTMSVPSHLSPGEDITENLLFALKHEGTNLNFAVTPRFIDISMQRGSANLPVRWLRSRFAMTCGQRSNFCTAMIACCVRLTRITISMAALYPS
jgi:hypothetical protein